MILLCILLFITHFISRCHAVTTINLVNYEYRILNELFNTLVSDFNDYAKEHNLDATIKTTTYTIANCSSEVDDYGSILEHLLKKKSQKYDLIVFDNMYSPRYAPYLEDLSEWLPKDHMDMYTSGIANKTCTAGGKFVALPLIVDYSLLYSNTELLDRYQKPIPKTWSELLETGNYILKMEKEKGNDIVGYNGLFAISEAAMCSITEFIYSFRKTIDSPYPDYSSQEAIDALNMLKRIKNELSSDESFKQAEFGAFVNIMEGKNLFVKYWNMDNSYINPVYNRTVLVGNHEGVSGSSVGLYNIGLNTFIDDEKKKLAAEVIKFITSWDIQKKYVMGQYRVFTGISGLYDDEEACENFDCKLAKEIQAVARPSSLTNNYDEYSTEFRRYLYEFLYEDGDAKETLDKIIDISKIYTISIRPSESVEGFVIFIISITIGLIMLCSVYFLFDERFKKFFDFFSLDSWTILFTGFFLNFGFIITEYGEFTMVKCHLKNIFMSVSCTCVYTPILYQLVSNLPKTTTMINWIKSSKWRVLILLLLYDVLINFILIITNSLEPKEIVVKDGRNFKNCLTRNTLGGLFFSAIFIEKGIIVVFILLLIFIEWNITKTRMDIKLITAAVYSSILISALLMVVFSVDINNFSFFIVIRNIIIIAHTISHYAFIYASRIILFIFHKQNEKLLPEVKPVTKVGSSNITVSKNARGSLDNVETKSRQSKNALFSEILNLHYYSGEDISNRNTIGPFEQAPNSTQSYTTQSNGVQRSNNALRSNEVLQSNDDVQSNT